MVPNQSDGVNFRCLLLPFHPDKSLDSLARWRGVNLAKRLLSGCSCLTNPFSLTRYAEIHCWSDGCLACDGFVVMTSSVELTDPMPRGCTCRSRCSSIIVAFDSGAPSPSSHCCCCWSQNSPLEGSRDIVDTHIALSGRDCPAVVVAVTVVRLLVMVGGRGCIPAAAATVVRLLVMTGG